MDRSGATSRYRRKLTGSRRDRTPHNVPSNRYRIPMDTLALRLAAADGSVDGIPVRRLVAAGFTLLQRSAPLVKALGARRSGVWLRPSPAWVVALAASDGRGAVLLDTEARGEMGPAMLERLKRAVIDNANVFDVLMDAVRVCSLGQITHALFEVGGQYRRSM